MTALEMLGSDHFALLTPSRLNQRYSVCMVVYLHLLRPLITFGILIVFKKFLMKVQCVISYGLIQMIAVVGEFLLVELDIPLAK